MIIISLDDAVNTDNWDLYASIFEGRTNPNGCPIHGTFYVSHEYTNYQYIQKLWNAGHEIAVHSITHRTPEEWWRDNATIEDWFDEMVGQANIINRFAGVDMEEIRGIRVPFLKVGWNRQFIMMREFGFVYDSSLTAPFSDPPLWPYTLDYSIPHVCIGENKCPSRSFPGIWEMVMNQLEVEGHRCAMVDSCPTYLTEEDIFNMLMHNFKRHYISNRAPLGLYFHTIWFKKASNRDAFKRFLDEMKNYQDVYFVTNWEAIQWMQKPTNLQDISKFQPWKCDERKVRPEDTACNLPNHCKLYSRELRQERFLPTCFECPDTYPWIKNEFGITF